MAQVEVGLGAVVEDVDLAVLVGAHRAGIDVDVGIELLQPDAQAAVLQQHADRGAGQPLAQRADDAAGDEDVLGHAGVPRLPNGQAHGAVPVGYLIRMLSIREPTADARRRRRRSVAASRGPAAPACCRYAATKR